MSSQSSQEPECKSSPCLATSEDAAAQGAAAQPLPLSGGSGDAPPTNRASHGYGQGKREYRLLRVGVDSLYLSFYGDLLPGVENELIQRKHAAQSRYPDEKALAQWTSGKHVFEVSDKGQEGFAFVLQDGAFRLCLRAGQGGTRPVAYVKVSAELLAHNPLEAIADELWGIVDDLAEADRYPVVSRIDLYADFQTDTDIGVIPRDAWITEASGIDTYSRNGKFTGWVFGAGSGLSVRLYDKTVEIEKSHKTFFYELWQRGGWDGGTVWRLEMQFRRDVLGSFRLRTLSDVKEKLGGLWQAVTHSWLRLTVPNPDDSNRARWPLHPLWDYLGQIRWRLDDEPLTRSYTPARLPALEKLYRMFTALLTSYMTVNKLSVYGEGCVKLMEDCREWHESWCKAKLEISFTDWLDQKLRLKAREFNTRENRRTIRQDATTPDATEKGAVDYLKKSKGE